MQRRPFWPLPSDGPIYRKRRHGVLSAYLSGRRSMINGSALRRRATPGRRPAFRIMKTAEAVWLSRSVIDSVGPAGAEFARNADSSPRERWFSSGSTGSRSAGSARNDKAGQPAAGWRYCSSQGHSGRSAGCGWHGARSAPGCGDVPEADDLVGCLLAAGIPRKGGSARQAV